MFQEEQKTLFGKKLIGVNLEPGNEQLCLLTEDGQNIWLRVEAERCSETWIEHITEPKYPATILSVEEKDLGSAPATKQEYDKKYSTILATDQGNLEIEFRNSSNGYYGGSLRIEGWKWSL
jgi:hypothetical protein